MSIKKTEFIRRCRKCTNSFKTSMKYSKYCPECDKSSRRNAKNRDKILLDKNFKEIKRKNL